jgi:hypothetical protein
MPTVTACALPTGALLARLAQNGAYTDCYATDLPGHVTHAHYVAAFYTTPLFKVERFILKHAMSRPATDDDSRRLADGTSTRFSAWTVEARAPDQLLLCDVTGRTRSWLMVAPVAGPAPDGLAGGTRLYFGSAVVPLRGANGGAPYMGWGFRALLGFHKLYSVALLRSAAAALRRAG